MKTKLFQRFVLVALFSLGMLAETKSDYDRDYDFSRLRTWDFKRMHRMPTDPIRENPIWDERIRRAIEQHLTEAGFQRVVEGAPDFLVSYCMGVKERYDVRYLDYGFPGFWGHWDGWGGWGPGIGTVNVWKIPLNFSGNHRLLSFSRSHWTLFIGHRSSRVSAMSNEIWKMR